jgi:hypothetical protein
MGGDACARYWSNVDYFGWEEEITPLVPILRHNRHPANLTLLSLGRLTRDAPSTGAVEREDGEDKKQNKNDRGTLHLLKGEKIYTSREAT